MPKRDTRAAYFLFPYLLYASIFSSRSACAAANKSPKPTAVRIMRSQNGAIPS